MKRIISILSLLSFAATCLGQLPPYVRTPFTTNAATTVTNIVRSIAGTNGIQSLNGSGTNTTLRDPVVTGTLTSTGSTNHISGNIGVAGTLYTGDLDATNVIADAFYGNFANVTNAAGNKPLFTDSLGITNGNNDALLFFDDTLAGYTFGGDLYSAQYHGNASGLTNIPASQLTGAGTFVGNGSGLTNLYDASDVRRWGAVESGGDCSLAVSNAIAATGEAYFPAGYWNIYSNMVFSVNTYGKGVKLRGAGPTISRIRTRATSGAALMWTNTGPSVFSAEAGLNGLTVEQQPGVTGIDTIIQYSQGYWWEMKNCRVSYSPGDGVRNTINVGDADSTDIQLIEDCEFSYNTGAGWIGYSTNANVQLVMPTFNRCRFLGNQGGGLYLRGEMAKVTSCQFAYNVSGVVLSTDGAAGNITFDTCLWEQNTNTHLYMRTANNVKVENSEFRLTAQATNGIYIDGAAGTTEDTIIARNRFICDTVPHAVVGVYISGANSYRTKLHANIWTRFTDASTVKWVDSGTSSDFQDGTNYWSTSAGLTTFPGSVSPAKLGVGTTTPRMPIVVARNAAKTTPNADASSIHLGVGDISQDSYNLLTFGYSYNGMVNAPAYLGFQSRSMAGSTCGDLVFGVRSVTSDTLPTTVMRVSTNLDVKMSALQVTNSATIGGNVTATNGVYTTFKPSFSTNFTCTTNLQIYMANGTNQVITLPNAAHVPGVIYRFTSTNGYGNFTITNATGAQTIRDGTSLSFSQIGIGSPAFVSDGGAWWPAARTKVVMPNAQFSLSTNVTVGTTAIPVPWNATDFNNSQGIALGVGSNGFHTSIWITNAGQYEFAPSAIETFDGNNTITFWFKAGASTTTLTNIPASATFCKGQNLSVRVVTVPFIVHNDATTCYELWAICDDAAGNSFAAQAAGGAAPNDYPASPAIIMPVKRVSDHYP